MILGVTGMLGAGKGTVVEYLETKGFKIFAVSDTFLVSEAMKRGLEPTRDSRRIIANEYRSLGPTKLQEAVYEMARKDIEAGHNVVIEPQHTAGEVRFIQTLNGVVLSVDADIYTRYERIKKRATAKDDVTFDEFKDAEERESHSDNPNENNLIVATKEADIHITNDGTLEELHTQVDVVLESILTRNT